MIDRTNPLYVDDYKFTDIYLLAAAAEDEPSTMENTVRPHKVELTALRKQHSRVWPLLEA